MPFIGFDHEEYAKVLFMIFAVISGSLCIIQLLFLQKLNILSVYLQPLLSFCICYENVALYMGSSMSSKSAAANVGNFFHSLEIPLFIIVLYEVSFRLHEARSAQFLYCIRFDQGKSALQWVAPISLWIVRLIAAGLFVINILVDFDVLRKQYRSPDTGKGGYYSLGVRNNATKLTLWLALIPPIVLSAAGLLIGISLYRFGHNYTIGIRFTRRWRVIIITAVCQLVGQCFGSSVYPVTSNAGQLALLIGSTVGVWIVQEDLELAGTFADFLRSSNVAFNLPLDAPPKSAFTVKREHPHVSLSRSLNLSNTNSPRVSYTEAGIPIGTTRLSTPAIARSGAKYLPDDSKLGLENIYVSKV